MFALITSLENQTRTYKRGEYIFSMLFKYEALMVEKNREQNMNTQARN